VGEKRKEKGEMYMPHGIGTEREGKIFPGGEKCPPTDGKGKRKKRGKG